MNQLFIHIDKILIPANRQRREFSNASLVELGESIQYTKAGLQHAPVVRRVGDDFFLVSGERRLRAIKDIYELGGTFRYSNTDVPKGMVPCTNIGALSPLEAWEAELDENIRRSDLTWQERAQATSDLANLRTAQAEASGEIPPSNTAVAEELQCRPSTVKQERIVAQHLDNEEVRKAPNLKEAMKVLIRAEQKTRHEELAKTVGKTLSSASHKVFHQDSREWLEACSDSQFSVILTDPPYGMGADTFGDSGGKAAGAHAYKDSYETWQDLMVWFSLESFRVAAPQAHLYCFLDLDNFHEAKHLFEAVGWSVFRTPLIWYKPSAYRAPWPDKGPQRKYEAILYAVKGDKKVNHLSGDVLTYQPDENIGHQAQKPVALYVDLLKRSVSPGDKVLDPFCGSGTIFPAAHIVQCVATGIDMMEASVGMAMERIKRLDNV